MMGREEILSWLFTLEPCTGVSIDEGGLMLVAEDDEAYLEIGGEPVAEQQDEKSVKTVPYFTTEQLQDYLLDASTDIARVTKTFLKNEGDPLELRCRSGILQAVHALQVCILEIRKEAVREVPL